MPTPYPPSSEFFLFWSFPHPNSSTICQNGATTCELWVSHLDWSQFLSEFFIKLCSSWHSRNFDLNEVYKYTHENQELIPSRDSKSAVIAKEGSTPSFSYSIKKWHRSKKNVSWKKLTDSLICWPGPRVEGAELSQEAQHHHLLCRWTAGIH